VADAQHVDFPNLGDGVPIVGGRQDMSYMLHWPYTKTLGIAVLPQF